MMRVGVGGGRPAGERASLVSGHCTWKRIESHFVNSSLRRRRTTQSWTRAHQLPCTCMTKSTRGSCSFQPLALQSCTDSDLALPLVESCSVRVLVMCDFVVLCGFSGRTWVRLERLNRCRGLTLVGSLVNFIDFPLVAHQYASFLRILPPRWRRLLHLQRGTASERVGRSVVDPMAALGAGARAPRPRLALRQRQSGRAHRSWRF